MMISRGSDAHDRRGSGMERTDVFGKDLRRQKELATASLRHPLSSIGNLSSWPGRFREIVDHHLLFLLHVAGKRDHWHQTSFD